MNGNVYVDPQVRQLRQLYADLFAADFPTLPIVRQLERQADRLARAHREGNAAICFQIGSWHPRLVGRTEAQIVAAPFTLDDAKTTLAREYGFATWRDVEALGETSSDTDFERTVDTLLDGDLDTLRTRIAADPNLVRARSRYGHRATLLHYAGSNGVESHRQVVPLNLADLVDGLLAAGADPKATAAIYGGSTPRQLFDTSKHPYEAGVHAAVSAVFDRYDS